MSRWTIRPIVDNGDGTSTVVLTKGLVAVIDTADAAVASPFNWYARPMGATHFAARKITIGGRADVVFLQDEVSNAEKGAIEHADGNGLDCRRGNLRPAHRRSAAHQKVRRLVDNRDGTFTVPLTMGKVAIIDACDYAHVSQFNWHVVKNKKAKALYAGRTTTTRDGRKIVIRMHVELLPVQDGLEVDHADGNGLNNRRSNMRAATPQQNSWNKGLTARNTSGFKGVRRANSRLPRWQASICCAGTYRHLGTFDTPEEAAEAYRMAAAELHGEFARAV